MVPISMFLRWLLTLSCIVILGLGCASNQNQTYSNDTIDGFLSDLEIVLQEYKQRLNKDPETLLSDESFRSQVQKLASRAHRLQKELKAEEQQQLIRQFNDLIAQMETSD